MSAQVFAQTRQLIPRRAEMRRTISEAGGALPELGVWGVGRNCGSRELDDRGDGRR